MVDFTHAPLPPLKSQRLLDQARERVRCLHYSLSTECAYVHWIRGYVRHHGMRHPKDMGAAEVEAFLSWLAADRCVAVSTHRQALSALLLLYQQVLGLRLPWMDEIVRPPAAQAASADGVVDRRGVVGFGALAGRASRAGAVVVRHRHAHF